MYKLFANDCTSSRYVKNQFSFVLDSWTPYMYLTTTIFCIHTPINKKKVIISLAAKSASDKEIYIFKVSFSSKKILFIIQNMTPNMCFL